MQKVMKWGAAGAALTASGLASAQAAGSYGGILSGLSTGDAVTAVIGAAALIAGLGFAKWAAKKVASFFG